MLGLDSELGELELTLDADDLLLDDVVEKELIELMLLLEIEDDSLVIVVDVKEDDSLDSELSLLIREL